MLRVCVSLSLLCGGSHTETGLCKEELNGLQQCYDELCYIRCWNNGRGKCNIEKLIKFKRISILPKKFVKKMLIFLVVFEIFPQF